MNAIFADLIAEGKVAVYLDDILVWSSTLEEHWKIVHEVLRHLEEHNLYLQPEKCEFEQSHVDYLGLVISPSKVSMDPVKVQAVRDWTPPTKLKEVQSFIGFANFYRHFIKDFSKICRPLHNLTKKDVPFVWGPAQQATFEILKAAFMTKPVLAIWSPNRPTRIEVDASGYATGRVISQKCDNLDSLWHPIAFRSASFKEAKRNYEIWDCEMLAITKAFKNWRQFLAGLDNPFKIWTNHRNLEFWCTMQHLTRRQARWALLLANYNFVLIHKPGKENGIADPLSHPSRFQVTDAEDNRDQLILNPECFATLAATAFAKPPALEQKI
jgi:hypothetical protein